MSDFEFRQKGTIPSHCVILLKIKCMEVMVSQPIKQVWISMMMSSENQVTRVNETVNSCRRKATSLNYRGIPSRVGKTLLVPPRVKSNGEFYNIVNVELKIF